MNIFTFSINIQIYTLALCAVAVYMGDPYEGRYADIHVDWGNVINLLSCSIYIFYTISKSYVFKVAPRLELVLPRSLSSI